jgi:hypothetical protein
MTGHQGIGAHEAASSNIACCRDDPRQCLRRSGSMTDDRKAP